MNPNDCLRATEFLDYDHPLVQDFVQQHVADDVPPLEKIKVLYTAVRDGFRYDAFRLDFRREGLKASNLVARDHGYCVEKAGLYAACLRAVGIPSRLFFGDVRNHIAVDRLVQILGTDRLIFHGGTEVWNGSAWVKATPAFNAELCDYLNVPDLEFDGSKDSLFQAFDHQGGRFMEYLHEYGSFSDIPYDLFMDRIEEGYHFSGLRGKVVNLRDGLGGMEGS